MLTLGTEGREAERHEREKENRGRVLADRP